MYHNLNLGFVVFDVVYGQSTRQNVYCACDVYDLFEQHMFALVISSGNGTHGCGFTLFACRFTWQHSDKEDEQGQSSLCFKY